MTKDLAPVAALLLTTAVLLLGQGLQGILLPIEAARHGFSTLAIGAMGSFYFAGFISGSLRGPMLVRRVGHIRTFAALSAIASIVPLIHLVLAFPSVWIALRGITGFCFAGLFMTVESWLNEMADNASRGRIFSAYSTINLVALMSGQLLLFAPDQSGFVRFVLASILVSLAAVPVTFTRLCEPKPIGTARIDITSLYEVSPVAVACSFGIGIASAVFWTLGPVFAAEVGHDERFVAGFMGLAIFGAILSQIPLGRLSDRGDRRRIIAAGALVAAFAAVALALAARFGAPGPLLLMVGLMFGASALSIWAIVVSHANDAAMPGQFVQLSSSLLLIYGVGASIGPLLASLANSVMGGAAIFAICAFSYFAMAFFTIYRMGVRSVVARSRFVDSPRTATSVFTLDPRAAANDGSRI